MRRFIAALTCSLLLLVPVLAQSPPLIITDSGYYLTIVDGAGEPSLAQVDEVIDLRSSPGDPPPKPDDPVDPDKPKEPEPPTPGISADVASWATEIGDWSDSQRYALIFEVVRDGVRTGSVSLDKRFEVLNESANSIMNDEWDGFREKLSDYFNDRLSETGRLSKADAINELELVRYGISYSARNSKRITTAEQASVVSTVNNIIKEATK